MSGAIERLSFRSAAERLKEHLARADASPVVITESVDEEVREQLWSPAALLDALGERTVNVLVSETGRFDFTPEGERRYTSTRRPFDQALPAIMRARLPDACLYLRQLPLREHELDERGLPGQRLIAPGTDEERRLWIASADCVTPLHYDGKHNLLTQISGRKVVRLFPSSEQARMYPYGLRFEVSHLSRVDPEELDGQSFPEFPSWREISFVLDAGETLFIPAFWWHHVRSLDFSVSINEWWPPPAESYLAENAADYLRLKYGKERLAKIFSGEAAGRRPHAFARLARLALTHHRALASTLFCGAATRLCLRLLLTEETSQAPPSESAPQLSEVAPQPSESVRQTSHEEEEQAHVRALVERGLLTPRRARQVQLRLFLAQVAAAQGRTPSLSELQTTLCELFEFLDEHSTAGDAGQSAPV